LKHGSLLNGNYAPKGSTLKGNQHTQDLFAAGKDGAGISQAMRWSSPSTALRYGRNLAVKSNVVAGVLAELRR
jgi:hypothetical protein